MDVLSFSLRVVTDSPMTLAPAEGGSLAARNQSWTMYDVCVGFRNAVISIWCLMSRLTLIRSSVMRMLLKIHSIQIIAVNCVWMRISKHTLSAPRKHFTLKHWKYCDFKIVKWQLKRVSSTTKRSHLVYAEKLTRFNSCNTLYVLTFVRVSSDTEAILPQVKSRLFSGTHQLQGVKSHFLHRDMSATET